MKTRETVVVSIGLVIQQVTVFGTSILIARRLGAGDYAILATLKNLSSFILIVAPLGLDLALLKHASLYHDRPAELKTISNFLRQFAAGLSLLLLVLVAACFGQGLQSLYSSIPHFRLLSLVTIAGLVFAVDVQISGALYRATDRVSCYALVVNYAQPVLRLILSAVTLALGGDVIDLTCVNAFSFFMTFLFIAYLDRRGTVMSQPMPLRVIVPKACAVLSESVWMALSLLIYSTIRLFDVLVLAALTTLQVTGQYTAVSTVAQIIQIYPIAISQALGPRIAFLYKLHDCAGITDELRTYIRKASILGGYLFGGVVVFGTDLDLLFGRSFAVPELLVLLLATGWYISATLAPVGYVLSMTGRHRQELAILFVGAIVLVVSLFSLVPSTGSIGAALSVLITFALVNAARCLYVIQILQANPLSLKEVLLPVLFLCFGLVCRQMGAEYEQPKPLPISV